MKPVQYTKWAAFVITGVFCVNQSLAFQPQKQLSVSAEQNLSQLDTLLDQNLDSVSQVDQQDEQNEAMTATQSPSSHQEKIQARWERKLVQALPQMISQFNLKVDKMGETELSEMGSDINAAKEKLKSGYAHKMTAMMSTLPKEIAASGGLAPFLLHLKQQLKDAKAHITSDDSNTDWSSITVIGAVALTMGFVLGVAGLVAAITVLPFIGAALLAGGVAVLIVGFSHGGDID
jgi:hypothetical protein